MAMSGYLAIPGGPSTDMTHRAVYSAVIDWLQLPDPKIASSMEIVQSTMLTTTNLAERAEASSFPRASPEGMRKLAPGLFYIKVLISSQTASNETHGEKSKEWVLTPLLVRVVKFLK